MEKLIKFLKEFGKEIYWSCENDCFAIALGCELNFLEVEKIKHLVSKYYAKFNIVNTCAVHSKNLRDSIDIVEEVLEAYPTRPLFIVGCASETFRDYELQHSNVFVVNNVNKMSEKFYQVTAYAHPQLTPQKEILTGRIKIQDGCNCNCSYCIIPQLRGKSVSVPYSKILEDAKRSLDSGRKDLTLVGVNITQYSEPDTHDNLVMMVERLLGDLCNYQFTLGLDSVDPAWLGMHDLITLIKYNPKMKKELYLATQSGSDKILKAMRRAHTKQRVLNIINEAKGIRIRHDFIVGFPGETEEDFQETVDMMRRTQDWYNYGVISEFTAHPGTDANGLEKLNFMTVASRREKLQARKNKIITMLLSASDFFKATVTDKELKPKKVKELVGKLKNDDIKQIRIVSDMNVDNWSELIKNIGELTKVKVNYQRVIFVANYGKDFYTKLHNIPALKFQVPDLEFEVDVKLNQEFLDYLDENINVLQQLNPKDVKIRFTSLGEEFKSRDQFLESFMKLIKEFTVDAVDNFPTRFHACDDFYIYKDNKEKCCMCDIERLIRLYND